MSLQIFLQTRLVGTEKFLSAGDPAENARLISAWSHDLPLKFLFDQGLSPILLGSSGGGQFLLVLPEEVKEKAEEFLQQAKQEIFQKSGESVHLVWASTENLGTWKLIRERLDSELHMKAGIPAFPPRFSSFPAPARTNENQSSQSVLRGDVDYFARRLQQADSIESHVATSVLFSGFFAGEVARLCEGKANLIFTGGDDFAISGNWKNLIQIAAELHRLFTYFVEENLKDAPGMEGKTLSMALTIAEKGQPFSSTFAKCGEELNRTKTIARDSFCLFGTTIEWKQFPEAANIKDLAVRLIREFHCSRNFINELLGFYPENPPTSRKRITKFDRPWRFYRRLAVTLDPGERRVRSKEYLKVRSALAGEIIGKNVGQARLRSTGKLALEWAGRIVKD